MYDIVVHDLIQFVKEVIVDTLIIEEDRPTHIAKHNIIIDEILEVLTGDYVYIAGRENRWLIIGKTARKVFLTIVLGERPEQNTYGLITARPARRKERSFYIEYTTQKGGEEEDEDKAS
jgi:uncharacterized DUF497 family protein